MSSGTSGSSDARPREQSPRSTEDTGGSRPPGATGDPPSRLDRLRGRDGDRSDPPAPWRVEGMRGGPPSGTPGQSPRRINVWWLLLGALAINWLVMSLLFTAPTRTTVSYTFFTEQLNAGNVQTVTSTADTIQGAFKKPATYPTGPKTKVPVEQFATQRPSFATDDLLAQLQAQNVSVNAKPPDAGAPLWQQLLLGF